MKGLLIIFLIIMFESGYSQWQQQENFLSHWTGGSAIDAYDSLNAVLHGNLSNNQGFYITKDGGDTWNPRIIVAGNIIDVDMIDPQNILYGTDKGSIYRTSDGGVNWESVYSDLQLTNFIDYIEFFDSIHGIAIGDCISQSSDYIDRPAILFSGTYGMAWSQISVSTKIGSASGDTWRRIDFVDVNIGYFRTSGNLQGFYKTTDGGHNWIKLNPPGEILLLKFYDKFIGLISTYPKGDGIFRVYLTIDGGNTWNESNNVFISWPMDFEFIPTNPYMVWFVNNSSLYFSSDMGLNWTEQKIIDGQLNGRDIVFVDDKHGWLLCDDGVVFHTNNNGGVTTDVNESYNIKLPLDYKLEQNYPNPFNPNTIISYHLPEGGYVVLKLYDVLGKEIKTLVNNYQSSGKHSFNFDAATYQSGIYFYRLTVNNFSQTKKMVILK